MLTLNRHFCYTFLVGLPCTAKILAAKASPTPLGAFVFIVIINYRVFNTKFSLSKPFDELPLQYFISQVSAYTDKCVLLILTFLGVRVYILKRSGCDLPISWPGEKDTPCNTAQRRHFPSSQVSATVLRKTVMEHMAHLDFVSHNKETSYQKQRVRSDRERTRITKE